MAHNGKQDESEINPSRRRYIQAIVASTLAGAAGCNQGGDTSDEGGNTTTTTTGGNETNASDGGDAQGDPVSTTITSVVNNTPQNSELNPWIEGADATGQTWVRELCDPRNVVQGSAIQYNGAEYETPWIEDHDTIELPTITNDLRYEPPYDKYWDMNTELTYWNGEPINAPAKLKHEYLYYGRDNQIFNETATFNNEVIDDSTFHWWNNKGEVEGQQANPQNVVVMQTDVPTEAPFNPTFTTPYYERFQDAANSDEVNQIANELTGDRVTYNRIADEQLMSGLYKVESTDDVSAERMLLKKRDDHPNDWATIPELELRFANADRQDILNVAGKIDIDEGIISESGGAVNREMLPDYIQQVDSFLQTGGDQILFNWNNKHLQNVWVRRALIAAADWETATANGWGPNGTIPIEDHTGMLQTVSQGYFSDEFLNSLYSYPTSGDKELAAEWMRKGGYTLENGIWTAPDGTQAELNLVQRATYGGWVTLAQSLQAEWQDFGFKIGLNAIEGSAHNNALKPENLNYDVSQIWGPNGETPHQVYWTQGFWYIETLVGGDGNDPLPNEVDAETTGPETTHDVKDIQNMPLEVDIPNDPQNIELVNEASGSRGDGDKFYWPDLPDSQSESIDLATLIHELRSVDTDAERYREISRKCARFYNFYMKDFVFHQYTSGLKGNVRDFTYPPEGHELNRVWHEFGGDDFEVLSGSVQAKYNEEYEPPQ